MPGERFNLYPVITRSDKSICCASIASEQPPMKTPVVFTLVLGVMIPKHFLEYSALTGETSQ